MQFLGEDGGNFANGNPNVYYKSAPKVCQNKYHCIVCILQNILNLTDWSSMIHQRVLYLLNVNPVLY